MQYYEFELSKPLSEYIQSMWAMESENDDDHYPRSQIMPDGIVEIIFHYEIPFNTYQDGLKFLQPQNFAISMMRKYVEIESTGKTGFISVRFFPSGAYHFFDLPIKDFLDTTIDARNIWGNLSDQIIYDLKEGNLIKDRFKTVESFLLQRLSQFKKENSKIDDAIRYIRDIKGQASIEEVCNKFDYGKKQFERDFVSAVGVTPKIFSRICRFLFMCQQLDKMNGKTLSELTHECGYYDQAHFIKDFKEFSGFTPKEFFARENIYFTDI